MLNKDKWPAQFFAHSDGRTIDLTVITTPFGLLDEETQAALKAHGGPYERYCENSTGANWNYYSGIWVRDRVYRVKPAPKVETVTLYGRASSSFWGDRKQEGDTHAIIFFRDLSGKPDCSSIKMEEL